jgi:hypothetical protein
MIGILLLTKGFYGILGRSLKMINELYALSDVLTKAHICPKEWHREFKPLPKASVKSPCFRIFISSKKSIANIDEIAPEKAAKLRKWEPSNGVSFPAFNMPALYRIHNENQVKKLDEILKGKTAFNFEEIKSWCTAGTNNWDKNTVYKLEKCMHELTEKLQEKENKKKKKAENSVTELIRIVKGFNIDSETPGEGKSFRLALERYIFEKLKGKDDIKTLLRFLFYAGDSKKKPEKDRGGLSVFLDLGEYEQFSYPISHDKNISWLNAMLLSYDDQAGTGNFRDAFGEPYMDIDEKMPGVKLEGLAEVKLRSMFKDHLCQYRYGLIEGASYPISKENRTKIKGTLEWLSDQERKGKNWGLVGGQEMIFAHPSILPKEDIRITDLLGAADEETTSAQFADLAGQVIKALYNLMTDKSSPTIQIFSIRKMDKARSKIVFYRNYSAQRIIDSAEDWKKGCENIPAAYFSVWSLESKKPERIGAEIPKPLQMAVVINRVWKMNGVSAGETKKIKYYQGLELLFEQNQSELALYLLSTLIIHSTGLVLYLGNLLNGGGIIPSKLINKYFIFVLPVFGLLLYRLGYFKEEYMENKPYLIGQIMKISDELHALYCKVVRKGEIPPQLVGNSLMNAALETPVQALAQLSQRLMPYIGWAEQYRTKGDSENNRNADRYLRLLEDAITRIGKLEPIHFGDLEKAQGFIGYLAALQEVSEKQPNNGKAE